MNSAGTVVRWEAIDAGDRSQWSVGPGKRSRRGRWRPTARSAPKYEATFECSSEPTRTWRIPGGVAAGQDQTVVRPRVDLIHNDPTLERGRRRFSAG